MKSNSGKETPQPVPLQRSPVYLQQQQPEKAHIESPVAPPNSVQKKPTTGEDPFQLMPLKKRTASKARKATPATAAVPDTDDIYGFDFNESSEPQQKKKKPVAAKKRAVKPKQPRAKKHTEPSGMKLWDDKDFNHRQRQIKVTVINKDFKAQEKPIPPPSIRPVVTKNLQQFRTNPQMNSTAKDHLTSPPPPEIQITDINIEPVERHHQKQRQPQPDPSKNLSGGDNNSRLIPWRYSTIRNASVANVTMSSLNDSNAENCHPASKSGSRNLAAAMSRPLHTLQLQRSPMKELNPNETILVPRPIKNKSVSPTKRVFGVENNFGFDSDNEENDPENLATKRKKMSEKLDSLKKFRHSLNVTNSSSPLAGPMRVPARTKVPDAPVLPKQVTAIRNIFTSTPQQVKIRDAFKASTPIAGSSKQLSKDLDESTTTTTTDEGHKLFESLTFEAPPKRNYSAMAPRRKKKVDFYGFSDDDDDASADEKDDSETSVPRPRVTKKAKVQLVQEVRVVGEEFEEMSKSFS